MKHNILKFFVAMVASIGTVAHAAYPVIPVPVVNGGTGVQTLTSNALLIGNGTSPVQVLAPTNNSLVYFNGSGAPAALSGSANNVVFFDGSAALTQGKITDANIDSAAAIDATKIADGSVSNTEFQYLAGVTQAIQTQINNIVTGGGFASTALDNLASTAVNVSLIPGSDNSINLGDPTLRWQALYASSINNSSDNILISVQSARLYDGAGGAGANQSIDLGGRALLEGGDEKLVWRDVAGLTDGITATVDLAFLGTATIQVSTAQQASRVPVIDSSRKIVSSSVTTTELGYLSGVTAGIQGQINAIASGSTAGQFVVVDNGMSPYSASVGENILCDATAGNVVIELPTVSSGNQDKTVEMKKISSAGLCIAQADVGNAIDGLAGVTSTARWDNRVMTSAGALAGGTNWYVR